MTFNKLQLGKNMNGLLQWENSFIMFVGSLIYQRNMILSPFTNFSVQCLPEWVSPIHLPTINYLQKKLHLAFQIITHLPKWVFKSSNNFVVFGERGGFQ